MKKFLATTLLLIVGATPALADPGAENYRSLRNSAILSIFDEMIFEPQFGSGQEREADPRLRKWRNPIRIQTLGTSDLRILGRVQETAALLSRTTSHAIRVVESASRRDNMVVIFGTRQNARMLIDPSPLHRETETAASFYGHVSTAFATTMNEDAPICLGTAFSNQEGEIFAAVIFTNLNQTHEGIRSCISEEISQSMGLFADVANAPTSFGFGDVRTLPTSLDLFLLCMLYQPELTPGDTRATTAAVAIRLIRQLKASGACDAETRAR